MAADQIQDAPRESTSGAPRLRAALVPSPVSLEEFRGPEVRKLAVWALGVSLFMASFAASFLGAFHKPSPHHVSIAVVAPASAVSKLQHGLNAAAPGAFTLHRYRTQAHAATALRDSDVYAVFVPPSPATAGSKAHTEPIAKLLTASALGKLGTEITVKSFTSLTGALGATAVVKDLVPLPPQDPFGISSFFFSIGVFVPSFIAAVMLSVLFRRAPSVVRVAGTLVTAVCFASIDVAIADPGLGALTAHPAALIGVAALGSLAFSAPTAALGRLLGVLGIPVAALVFVVLGLPASGTTFGTDFLPGFHRFVSPGLPLTNVVVSVRNVSYFHDHGLAGPLGVLTIWAGAGLLALCVLALVERRRRPATVTASPQTIDASSNARQANLV